MSKITLDGIREELTKEKWEILSTEYTNLSTEMKFKCPEGHMVFSSWEKMRKKLVCPVCKQNTLKENKPIILEKKKGITRIIGLDQATYNTGWSVFDGNQLVKYGVFKCDSEDEVKRFNEVKVWLLSMIESWRPDVIGIEGIQYQQMIGITTFQTLARLQGILMDLCYENGIDFEICPTNTWRAYCGVKGKTRNDKKASMQLLVKKWFDISVNDDSADAIGIGKYVSENYRKQFELTSWE